MRTMLDDERAEYRKRLEIAAEVAAAGCPSCRRLRAEIESMKLRLERAQTRARAQSPSLLERLLHRRPNG